LEDTGDPSGDTGIATEPEPAPARTAEPEELWEPEGSVDEVAFPCGVQVGDVGPHGAQINVWMNVSEGEILLARAEVDEWVPLDDSTNVIRDGVCCQTEIGGLEPDTAYCVVARSEGVRSTVTRFRTALAEDGFRQMTIGAACCLGGNRPWPSLTHVAQARPDVFMLLGDTVYADRAETLEGYREYWEEALTTQGLLDVSANSSLIATWDDHEVVNNFEGLLTASDQFEAGLAAFREGLPQTEGRDGGIWRKLSWGQTADIFVLDGRGERDGETQYLSPEQLEWFKSELLASTARFKLIMNSVPITDYSPIFAEALADDRWQGYPEQRREILDHILAHEVEGVLWITGDFHMSTASRIDPPGGAAEELWEIMVGTGGSFLNIAAELLEPREQFPVIFAQWCSTLFHLDPGTGQVRVEWVGDDGSVLDTFEIFL